MVVRSKSSSESEHWSDETDGNGVFEFKTVTVALIRLVAAGIVDTTATGVAVTVTVVVVEVVVAATMVVLLVFVFVVVVAVIVDATFGLECSFAGRRFSLIFVESFKFISLARFLLTSIVFTEFEFKTDIFYKCATAFNSNAHFSHFI